MSGRGPVVVLVCCGLAFAFITQNVVADWGFARLDPPVLRFMVSHRTGWLTGVFRTVTVLGSILFLWPVVALAGVVFRISGRGWLPGLALAASLAGAQILKSLVKALVGRPRPPAALSIGPFAGKSYPPGHVMQAFAVFVVLALLVWAGLHIHQRVAIAALTAAAVLAVGVSRIYLGVHWMTDVLGGLFLAGLWVSALILAAPKKVGASPGKGTRAIHPL